MAEVSRRRSPISQRLRFSTPACHTLSASTRPSVRRLSVASMQLVADDEHSATAATAVVAAAAAQEMKLQAAH